MSGYKLRSGSRKQDSLSPSPRKRGEPHVDSYQESDEVDSADEDEEVNSEDEVDGRRHKKRNTSGKSNISGHNTSSTSAHSPKSSNLYPKLSPSPKPGTKSTNKLYPDLSEERKREGSPKRPKASPSPTATSDSGSSSYFLYAILIVVAAAALFYCYTNNKANVNTGYAQNQVQKPYDMFRQNLKELQQSFTEQDQRLWRAIHAPVRRILLEAEPTYPAVLLFVVPKDKLGSETASCLAQLIVRAVNTTNYKRSPVYINSEDLSTYQNAAQKKVLDEKLTESLDYHQQYGVVVDHIEMLSPHATLLFHGYCDGDNAPYKKSVIVLVVHTDKDFSVLNEDSVDDLLSESWSSGLEEDKIPPLIARIANNKVLIKAEKLDSIKNVCQGM